MTRVPVRSVVAVLVFVLPASADAQWHTDLAVRTSGSVARSGDTLRVELIALAHIPVPFSAQVLYRFQEQALVTDEDGRESTVVRERVVTRPPGAIVDSLDPLASLVLDDTFHFGHGSVAGRYDVEVALLTAAGGTYATLRSCVTFQNPEPGQQAWPSQGQAACPLSLGGVERVLGPGWLVFEGTFPLHGRYTAVFVRDGNVLGMVDQGLTPSSSNRIDIQSPVLAALAGQTIDIVLHNHDQGLTTTLSRLVVSGRDE